MLVAHCFAPLARGAILLDSFTEGPFSLVHTPPNWSTYIEQKDLDTTQVLVGNRSPNLYLATSHGSTLSLTSGERGILNTNPGGGYQTTIIAYDPTSPLDVTQGGSTAFEVTLSEASTYGDVQIFAFTDFSHRGSASLTITGPGTYTFPFATLTPVPGEAPPDFTQLNSFYIGIKANGIVPAPVSYRVTNFQLIPEPASILPCAIGGVALMRRTGRPPGRSARASGCRVPD